MTTGYSAAAGYLQDNSGGGTNTDVAQSGQTAISHETYMKNAYEISDLESKKKDENFYGNKDTRKLKGTGGTGAHGHVKPIQQPRK
eukprot:CAMPEP_0185726504 /NCGR_PEP_ID=MMETSP1171-20130828/2465_1 /TAXON_ID=374046 /ORGANISM="Helicotheca tamensis, Strain CCMP826" /LENGTH=85 /DNA_ID=CAMNT_0028394873 /DNA_START=160 /DNA_END=417 /DNA_ORIENTATION=+